MTRLKVRAVLSVFVCMAAAGCAGVSRNPLPGELARTAQAAGIPNVRAWGDEPSPLFQADLVESIKQARAADPRGVTGPDGYINVLAISGGGPDGAFGAGLLCGWTDSGNRPPFKLVTGISTGALIAPFAFAGPEYDQLLRQFYTSVCTSDIYKERSLWSLLSGSDSMTDTEPLAKLLEKVVDERLLSAVAYAHRKGRRLYIGTTNLDAGRLTIWNMGAIAASGHPNAPNLFRKVMLASASIPVAFPPVYIPVEAGGKTYDEMHVDGGACVQVFFYGYMLDLPSAFEQVAKEARATGNRPPVRIYVIRNAQITTYWQSVKPRLLPIAGRAVSELLMNGGVGDLYRIYVIATRDGIDFKMTSIPPEFQHNDKEVFDREDMTRLFNLAFQMAKIGDYPWSSLPPGLQARPTDSVAGPTTRPVQ